MSRSHIEIDVPDQDLGLYGDPAALEHVLTNLLENAMKYSAPETTERVGSAYGKRTIRSTSSRSRIRGEGSSPEDLPHIFERFHQGERRGRTRSVGLGLYIVRSLVNAHGGRVWADSKLGEGTTFTSRCLAVRAAKVRRRSR